MRSSGESVAVACGVSLAVGDTVEPGDGVGEHLCSGRGSGGSEDSSTPGFGVIFDFAADGELFFVLEVEEVFFFELDELLLFDFFFVAASNGVQKTHINNV